MSYGRQNRRRNGKTPLTIAKVESQAVLTGAKWSGVSVLVGRET